MEQTHGPPAPERRRLRHNLPAQTALFVGREPELAAARRLLLRPDVRLLTLTGPAGTGKTRFALELAAGVAEDFADGVSFVPLADIRDPGLVAPAVARTLGVHEVAGRSPVEALQEHLSDRQVLLVLDNFEQVLEGAPLLSELLAAAPDLKVLVTSRAVLHLSGEHEAPIPPLRSPDPRPLPPLEALARVEAVALFVHRAQAARPDFRLTDDNASAVAELCRRLDGLPLALELAASRSKLVSPQAMLAHLGGRLALLTGGPCDRPARHQTLERAIAWSYDLLTPPERALFRRLAVFAGGCTLEAVQEVCATPEEGPAPPAGGLPPGEVDHLASLVDKSLLRPVVDRQGELRIVMLQTIRVFALEALELSGDAAPMGRRHAAFYVALAERAGPELAGPAQGVWLDRLETEHDNLRAALRWTVDAGEPEVGARLAAALWPFWLARGYIAEGQAWLASAPAAPAGSPGAPSAARAQALRGAGQLARAAGDYPGAAAQLEECLVLLRALDDTRGVATVHTDLAAVALEQRDFARAAALLEAGLATLRELGDEAGIAAALTDLGRLASDQRDFARAAALHAEALALSRRLGDKAGAASALGNLGAVAFEQRDFARAEALHAEALLLRREVGDKGGIARSLGGLGMVALEQGDHARAEALLEVSLTLRRELGARWAVALTLKVLGLVARARGDYARAVALHQESLALLRAVGDRRGVAEALEGLAGVAAVRGQPNRAARLFGAAAALREAIGAPLGPVGRAQCEPGRAAARDALGGPAFAAASAAGRALSVEGVAEEALSVDPERPGGPVAPTPRPTAARPAAAPAVSRPAPPLGTSSQGAGPHLAHVTPREQEVAALVAQGLTNSQIAHRLVVTVRTAENHVQSLLGKLGLRSRVQLAVWVLSKGLGAEPPHPA
jgi:non-specific serine/threonine protein kinase